MDEAGGLLAAEFDDGWTVDDALPEIRRGPITRGTLALFAGASGDHVLLHIDSDYAKAAGLDDVFAHGMLSMAYLAQVLTDAMPQHAIRSWSTRFLAVTPLHATVRCGGKIAAIIDHGDERCARVALWAQTTDGVRTLEGTAIVALPRSGGSKAHEVSR